MFEDFEIIDTYTRKQAIEDGYQMLLTDELAKMVKDVGYKWPMYVTNSVIEIIENACKKGISDFKGILWDILWMSRCIKTNLSDNLIKFKVKINGRYKEFFIQAGPVDIDDPEPCLTLMIEDDL